jgi:uncharacterized membrane protein YphA (DoxX/SURF4 family)
MAYSHTRFRKTLAIVRILTGAVFVMIGSFKVSSLEFGKMVFPQFLENAIKSGAAEWIRPLLEWVVANGPARIGVTIGFVELFIGIALVLGLAVRPAALLGMFYSAGLLVATWNDAGTAPSMLQSTEHQFRNLFPFLVFLLLGVGHAGETWGAGALYHRGRRRLLQRGFVAPVPPAGPVDAPVKEPQSFEEMVEQEERERSEREVVAVTPRDSSE